MATPSQPTKHSQQQPGRPRAVVTGATSGIGRAFADRLAGRGYDLLLTGRRQRELEAVQAELQQRFGVAVHLVLGDLRERAARERLVERVSGFEPLELLVNNVGFGLGGSFLEEPLDAHRAMLQVHNELALTLCHTVAAGMRSRGRGAIVNVSSLASLFPVPGAESYISTKAFLNALSESMATELRKSGVSVQALLPGFTTTDFHRYLADPRSFRRATRVFSWLSPDKVAAHSLRKLYSRSVICVPGFRNRLIYALGRAAPRRLLYRLTAGRR